MDIHIFSKYNMFGLYNATCPYVFRADHLALWLVCSSFRRPSHSQLPSVVYIVLCVGSRSHGLFPMEFGMPMGAILVQHIHLTLLGDKSLNKPPDPLALAICLPYLLQHSLSLGDSPILSKTTMESMRGSLPRWIGLRLSLSTPNMT